MAYDTGDLPQVQVTWTNLAGALTDATTVLTVTAPDGTITTPAVTHGTTGVYTATFTVTLAGTYSYKWTASGALTAVEESQIEVRPAGARIISLAAAKAQVGAKTTADEDELRDYIDAIDDVVDAMCTSMVRHTEVETVVAGNGVIALSNQPVISITSIVAAQTGFAAPLVTDLVLEPETGKLYPVAPLTPWAWYWWGRLIVTYVAGRQVIPASVNLAARIILANLWETQHNRGAGRATFGGEEMVPVPGTAYLIPYRAAALLEKYDRGPVFA